MNFRINRRNKLFHLSISTARNVFSSQNFIRKSVLSFYSFFFQKRRKARKKNYTLQILKVFCGHVKLGLSTCQNRKSILCEFVFVHHENSVHRRCGKFAFRRFLAIWQRGRKNFKRTVNRVPFFPPSRFSSNYRITDFTMPGDKFADIFYGCPQIFQFKARGAILLFFFSCFFFCIFQIFGKSGKVLGENYLKINANYTFIWKELLQI